MAAFINRRNHVLHSFIAVVHDPNTCATADHVQSGDKEEDQTERQTHRNCDWVKHSLGMDWSVSFLISTKNKTHAACERQQKPRSARNTATKLH